MLLICLDGVDKNTFYNSVDIICQPSNWEAFGLVFVEAAFFEIPSVSGISKGFLRLF
ncbi:glycosyltransferase [Escherichia coli]